MHKFRIGDKVRIVSLHEVDKMFGFKLGDEVYVLEDCSVPYCAHDINANSASSRSIPLKEEQLELVEERVMVGAAKSVADLRRELALTTKERDTLVYAIDQLINTRCFGGNPTTTHTYLKSAIKDIKEMREC